MSLKNAKLIAKLLDNQFNILGYKFGIDPLLGLVPGFGDLVSLLLSGYVIKLALEMKIPQKIINQMIANLLLDLVIGSVPVLGDAADFFYKASTKNIEILENYLQKSQTITEEGEVENSF